MLNIGRPFLRRPLCGGFCRPRKQPRSRHTASNLRKIWSLGNARESARAIPRRAGPSVCRRKDLTPDMRLNNGVTETVAAEAVSGVEIFLPLAKLKKSPRNARKVPHGEAAIAALAARSSTRG